MDSHRWSSKVHWAAAEGRTEQLGHLLKEGHNPSLRGGIASCWVRGADQPANRTPLHYAAKHGHLGCIKLLLSYGADPNSQDDDGYTPLHYLCQIHSPRQEEGETLRLGTQILLDFGANPKMKTIGGHTPLSLAILQSNLICRGVLEEHGMYTLSSLLLSLSI